MVDEFSKKFDMEIAKGELVSSNGIHRRHRNASLSDGEIMTILIVFHFGAFANFKHYHPHYIRVHPHQDFPDAASRDNKPEALQGYTIEHTKQLVLF